MWLFRTIVLLFPLGMAAQQPQRYDVVIQEIMADPSPAVGLPEAEYVELRNRSSAPVNLLGSRITTSSSVSGMIGNFLLQPDSVVILCAAAQVASFSKYGTTISVPSFPGLPPCAATLADQLFCPVQGSATSIISRLHPPSSLPAGYQASE